MIGRKGQSDHRPYGRSAINGYHAIAHTPDGQNARLRRHDYGRKGVDAVHSQIADGKCAARNVRRL